MKCKNCGKKLTGKENFCRICGTPVEHEEDNTELTDNIDVSKIEIAKKEIIPEDDTMELKANTKKGSSELSAMMELTSVENKDEEPVKEEKEEIVEDKTEEIEELEEIQKTEELLLEEKDSETKIKEILEEMKPENEELEEEKKEELTEEVKEETESTEDIVEEEKEEKVEEKEEDDSKESDEIVIDENQEPTAVIPEDLISKFEKEKEESKEEPEEKKEELTEESKEETESTEDIVEEEKEEAKEDIKEEEKEEEPLIVIEKEEPIDEKKNKIEESIISIVDDKTVPLEFDKTESFDKPIIPDTDYNMNKKDSKAIIFMILFILCLGVIGYLVFMNYSSSNKVDDMKKENEKLSNQVNELSKEAKKETKPETTNNSIVKYNGYSIDLSGYTYNFYNNSLVVNNNTYSIGIQIKSNLKYTSIKDNKDEYRKLFNSVQSYGTKVIEEKEYVVFEFKDATDNYLAAYTSLSDEDSVAYIINFKDKEIDYDVLLTTNKITSSSKVDSLSEKYDIELFEK